MEPKSPIVPCAAAMAAMGVPARRWATRADLLKQLDRAREHLDTCPLDRASVASAAEAAGLSLHHFHRLFRRTHGLTPHQYLTSRRLEEAKRLLRETGMPVGAIAVEVGFENPSAFGRLFRAREGTTPLAHRRATEQVPHTDGAKLAAE